LPKISALNEVTTSGSDSYFYMVDSSGSSKKIKEENLLIATKTGWTSSASMVYASSDAPNYVVTMTGDKSGIYQAGQRVKLTLDNTIRYFIVTKVETSGSTALTLYGGTDYVLSASPISNPYYSLVKAPFGFPLDPTKWTIEYSDISSREQGSPANGTWYNINSASISVPIGIWKIEYQVGIFGYKGTAAEMDFNVSLSISGSTPSDMQLTGYVYHNNVSYFGGWVNRNKSIAVTTKTTYYLISMSLAGTIVALQNRGDKGTTVIRAVCAYL